jgi:hypothetical protein
MENASAKIKTAMPFAVVDDGGVVELCRTDTKRDPDAL